MMESAKRILIAEDNPVLSDVLQFNLVAAGFEVLPAGDGLEAIAVLEAETVDLLITDFQMPSMNGDELCRYVRQQPRLEHLPILMCSAKGMEKDMADLRDELRIARLIYKPFSMREVVSAARELTGLAPVAG